MHDDAAAEIQHHTKYNQVIWASDREEFGHTLNKRYKNLADQNIGSNLTSDLYQQV